MRQAAAQCVKDVLVTRSGLDFWEQHKDNRDPMLAYLNPFRTARKSVSEEGLLCPHIDESERFSLISKKQISDL